MGIFEHLTNAMPVPIFGHYYLCGLWYPYSGRGHKNLTVRFITVIVRWGLHVEWVCYKVRCATRQINCYQLVEEYGAVN